ncbi:hypothetical protein EW145_g6237 [Phellinidium pouzarii]|uniref:Uncharacterized protein n=1 Tax=Phellinidium pouzarii TaxID=167371 RepID=A0A4S4KXS6_9AGAM|nr:hypothetical protein EW145_g6237 [Phellinidium pouzarii]
MPAPPDQSAQLSADITPNGPGDLSNVSYEVDRNGVLFQITEGADGMRTYKFFYCLRGSLRPYLYTYTNRVDLDAAEELRRVGLDAQGVQSWAPQPIDVPMTPPRDTRSALPAPSPLRRTRAAQLLTSPGLGAIAIGSPLRAQGEHAQATGAAIDGGTQNQGLSRDITFAHTSQLWKDTVRNLDAQPLSHVNYPGTSAQALEWDRMRARIERERRDLEIFETQTAILAKQSKAQLDALLQQINHRNNSNENAYLDNAMDEDIPSRFLSQTPTSRGSKRPVPTLPTPPEENGSLPGDHFVGGSSTEDAENHYGHQMPHGATLHTPHSLRAVPTEIIDTQANVQNTSYTHLLQYQSAIQIMQNATAKQYPESMSGVTDNSGVTTESASSTSDTLYFPAPTDNDIMENVEDDEQYAKSVSGHTNHSGGTTRSGSSTYYLNKYDFENKDTGRKAKEHIKIQREQTMECDRSGFPRRFASRTPSMSEEDYSDFRASTPCFSTGEREGSPFSDTPSVDNAIVTYPNHPYDGTEDAARSHATTPLFGAPDEEKYNPFSNSNHNHNTINPMSALMNDQGTTQSGIEYDSSATVEQLITKDAGPSTSARAPATPPSTPKKTRPPCIWREGRNTYNYNYDACTGSRIEDRRQDQSSCSKRKGKSREGQLAPIIYTKPLLFDASLSLSLIKFFSTKVHAIPYAPFNDFSSFSKNVRYWLSYILIHTPLNL